MRKEEDSTHIWHLISLLNCSELCVVRFVFRRRRFNEAVTLLNKAVKEEKREKGLYLNRGGEEESLPHTTHSCCCLLPYPFSSSLLPHFSFPPPRLLLFLLPSLDCFYRMNNLHFALPDYQQALELDQSDWSIQCRIAIVFCELGVECFGRGQYSEAEQHFSSAIQHNPKVSRFYFCRARARHEREVREELVSRVCGCLCDIL